MNVGFKFFGNENEVKSLYVNAKGNKNNFPFPFKKYDTDFCYDVVATYCKEIHPNVYEYGIGLGFQINRDNIIENLSNLLIYNDRFDFYRNIENVANKNRIKEWLNENLLIDIDLRPRSSVRDTGLILCNCEGTVDEEYINEVKASFYHVIPNLPKYEVGDKIGQIKLGFSFKMDFFEYKEFNKTNRGMGGHGSTNI